MDKPEAPCSIAGSSSHVGDELISHIEYKEKIKDVEQMQGLLYEE